jgi:two-component system chemotaxis sensor kinase CheA
VENGLVTPAAANAMSDADVARLIFRSGVSTSAEVSPISGRGVGLDLVHEIVMRLQGSVDVTFTPGRETRFVVDLPLTLAATLGVLFRAGGQLGALSAGVVERSLRLMPADFGSAGGRATVRVGNVEIPFVPLAQVLDLSPAPLVGKRKAQPALVLSLGGQRVALGVEEVLGHQELVVSSLGQRVSRVAFLSGASVLEDGRVVGVLNPAEILRRAQSIAIGNPQALPARARILVVDDSLTTRAAMKAILEVAGFAVLPACDGEEALSILRKTQCQLVVTDVQMPRLDGFALTRCIKGDSRLRSIPVILITSLEAPEHRAAGLQAGADGYLVKREVERGKLIDLVRQLLPAAA